MTEKRSMAEGCPVELDTMQRQGGESRLDPLIRNNPFPFYRALRTEEPVYYDPGLDVYLITRNEDVVSVLRDDENFSLEHGYQDRWANGFADELAEILERDSGVFVRDPVFDPPEHTRIRKLIEKAFTAHRVKNLEPRIRQIVIDIIEPLAQRGSADGMNDIGAPITVRIICEQLGLDYEDIGSAEKIKEWTTALLAQIGRMQTREEMLENAKSICEMQNYIIPRLRERVEHPREDMMTDLVHARLDDDERPSLSFKEQLAWTRAILIAGNDTTAAALTNLMLILAQQPDLAAQLYESVEDDRLMNRFVEEVLRLQPPVHGLYRTALKDIKIGDTTIPAGAQVCVLFASANDDESVYACPRSLDIQRQNLGRHLTFGAGIHRCIGAALAKMELKVAAQEIIRRLDNIRLAVPVEELTYLPTLATQTLESLPLTFTERKTRSND